MPQKWIQAVHDTSNTGEISEDEQCDPEGSRGVSLSKHWELDLPPDSVHFTE